MENGNKTSLKRASPLVALAALVGGVLFFGKPILVMIAANELEDGANADLLRFAASASPLACSAALSEKEKKSLDLLIEAYALAHDKYEECGRSLLALDRCLDKYAANIVIDIMRDAAPEEGEGDLGDVVVGALDRMWNRGERAVKKAQALYAAEAHIRKSLRRAIARARMINTYGVEDKEAKDSVVALLEYVDGVGLGDLLFDRDQVQANLKNFLDRAKEKSLKLSGLVKDKMPAVAISLSLKGETAAELIGSPKISAIIRESPVWGERFNRTCTPEAVLRALPNVLNGATGLAATIGKL